MTHTGLSDGQIVALITGAFLVGAKVFDFVQARFGTKNTADTAREQQLWNRITQIENNKQTAEKDWHAREAELLGRLEKAIDENAEQAKNELRLESTIRQLEYQLFVRGIPPPPLPGVTLTAESAPVEACLTIGEKTTQK